MTTPNDPQVYSCEQCGSDMFESEIVNSPAGGSEVFCCKDCADEWDLEQAEDENGS